MIYVGNRLGQIMAFGAVSNAPFSVTPVNYGSVGVAGSKTEVVTVTAHRALTVSAVSQATGVLGVPGQTGTKAQPVAPGVEGSTGVAGTEPIEGSNDPFTVSAPSGRVSVPSGGTFKFQVTYSPRSAGPVAAEVTLTTSAGPATVSLSGYGTAPGLLAVSSANRVRHDRDGSRRKDTHLHHLELMGSPETITGLRMPSGPFQVSGLTNVGTHLAPQQAVTASVSFNPAERGDFDSEISVSSDQGSVTLPVVGQCSVRQGGYEGHSARS